MVSSKKKWTAMNPIRRRMKKRKASSGQNGQLVHWWLLVHSGQFFGLGIIHLFVRNCERESPGVGTVEDSN
jgi:hypothetical protein